MNKQLLVLILVASLAGCAVPFRDTPVYRPAALGSTVRTAPALPGAAEKPLALEDCLRIALANNRGIAIADRRVLIARDRLGEAWAALLPKLTAAGRYDTRNNEQASFASGRELVTSDRTTRTAGLSLAVPIYDFGWAWNQREALRLRIDQAGLNSEKVRQDLDLALSQAYFRVLEAQKIEEVVDESLRTLEEQLQMAEDFFGQGLVAKNDVLAVEVQLAQRRQEQLRAENNVQLAIATLNRLMGLEVDRPTQVADVLEVNPWQGTFEAVLRVAIARRPDLLALRRQVEIAQAEYRSTRAGLLPRLDAFGSYNRTTNSFLVNKDWLSGGATVQFPLFDGGYTYAQLRRKAKEIAETIDLHDERVDDVVLGVKKAYLDLREAAGQIPVAKKSIEYAAENLRIVQDQYSQGLLTSAEVLAEEDRLTRARSTYLQSLYNYHEAFARLVDEIGGAPPEQ